MIIKRNAINKEEGQMEIKIVPMPNAFLIQISSDIVRGMLVMDHSLEKEDLDEITTEIFGFIDDISMRSLTDEDELPQ